MFLRRIIFVMYIVMSVHLGGGGGGLAPPPPHNKKLATLLGSPIGV